MEKDKKAITIETADIYLHFPYIMEKEANDLGDFLEEENIEWEDETDIFIDLQNKINKQKEVIDNIKKELIENEVLDELPFDVSERICDLFEEVSE